MGFLTFRSKYNKNEFYTLVTDVVEPLEARHLQKNLWQCDFSISFEHNFVSHIPPRFFFRKKEVVAHTTIENVLVALPIIFPVHFLGLNTELNLEE